MKFDLVEIEANYLSSLCWIDDHLIDWSGGGNEYLLDGSVVDTRPNYGYSFRFDSIQGRGEWAIMYELRGTKALVVHEGRVKRELNRSYYHANAYDYPLVMGKLFDERDVIIHCPEEYNEIQIELLETGERLTDREAGKAADVFHSGFSISPDGRFLLDCGWVWQPWSIGEVYDLRLALEDPTHLDSGHGMEIDLGEPGAGEVMGGAFVGGKVMLNYTDDDGEYDTPFFFTVSDLASGDLERTIPTEVCHSSWMAVDDFHVLGLTKYPQLIDVRTGELVHEWNELDLGFGTPSPSMGVTENREPMIAPDPERGRVAMGWKDRILVLTIDP